MLCQVDPINIQAHCDVLAGHLKVVDSLYQQQATSFAAKNIPDESLNLTGAGPAANSTEQSFIAADGAAGNTGTGHHGKEDKGYKIKADDPPAFHGDVKDYPLWKREWQEIMKGRTDSWIIRTLSQKCVKVSYDLTIAKRIAPMTTRFEAWEFLDQIFANPTVVSQRVTDEFFSLTPSDIIGHTPQLKLVELELELTNLLARLTGVKEQAQLKNNIKMITHAIYLLPTVYQDEFSKERQKACKEAKARHETISTENLFTLLQDFLTEKAQQFREFQPHLLMPPKKGGKKFNAFMEQSDYSPEEEDCMELSTNSFSGTSITDGGNKLPRKEWKDLTPKEKKEINEKQKQLGPCPVCKKSHTWSGRKGIFASDSVNDCGAFRHLSLEDRVAKYKQHGLCKRCLSWTHEFDDCTRPSFHCRHVNGDGEVCEEEHATLLHGPVQL